MKKELSTLDQYLTDPSWGQIEYQGNKQSKNQTKSFDE